LALTVGNYGRTASVYNLLSQSGRFGLSAEVARREIDQIVAVARQWRKSFFACGVSCLPKTRTTSLRPSCLSASSLKQRRIVEALVRAPSLP
jgi:hypothetical protein